MINQLLGEVYWEELESRIQDLFPNEKMSIPYSGTLIDTTYLLESLIQKERDVKMRHFSILKYHKDLTSRELVIELNKNLEYLHEDMTHIFRKLYIYSIPQYARQSHDDLERVDRFIEEIQTVLNLESLFRGVVYVSQVMSSLGSMNPPHIKTEEFIIKLKAIIYD